MKRHILYIALILLGLAGYAQDKSGSISKDNSYLDLSFNASDTVNESETYWILITAPQNYASMQDVYVDIDSVSGGPGVTIALYGRLTSSSSWTAVGDSVTWAGTVDTTFTMSFTTPNRYRYYKLSFRSDATDQQSLISDVQFKQWYSGGSVSGSEITDGTATLTGGALSGVTTLTLENGLTIDNAVNNKLEFNENSDELIWTFGSNTVTASSGDVTLFDYGTINLGTDALDLSDGNITNGGTAAFDQVQADATALVVGAGTETVTINSSDWDIGTTGNMSGIGSLTLDGALASTSTAEFSSDSDTLKINLYQELYPIDLEVGNVRMFAVDSTGKAKATNGVDLGTSKALTGTTGLTIGAGTETVAINSSDWDIDATGIATGMGDFTSNGKILTTDTVETAVVKATGNISGLINFATAAQVTGDADSIALTNAAFPTLAAGCMVIFVAEADNTGAVRIDYNGTVDDLYEVAGAAPGACDANDIRNGSVQMIIFDGTQWQQLSQSGN